MAVELTKIETIVDARRSMPGATLPVLHEIQSVFGYIPPDAIPIIAAGLNLSRAEIYGVITFYSDFRTTPPGKHIVQVCRGEACQAKGGETLEAYAKTKLGCDFHETSPDQFATLEPVFCLGNCGCSPSVRIDDDVFGRVDNDRFDELLTEIRETKRG